MIEAPANSVFDASGHDHGACIHDALARAETLCAQKGLRLSEGGPC